MLLAYTASFGGGFTATISAESPGSVGALAAAPRLTAGQVAPATAAASQSGPHHVRRSEMAGHRRRLACQAGLGRGSGLGRDPQRQCHRRRRLLQRRRLAATPAAQRIPGCLRRDEKVGWAVDAGVKINLRWVMFGAGDDIIVTGAYSQSAVWYSGLPDGMWGENGQVNGNGQPMMLADAFFNPLTNPWSTPRAWSVIGAARAPLDADHLYRSRRLGRRYPMEQPGRRLQHRVAGLSDGCGCAGRDVAACLQLDHWRGYRLEPGHQPELRPRVDVSGT